MFQLASFRTLMHGITDSSCRIQGNTKYRKGLHRTSRKTTKDCCRTGKDFQEDCTEPPKDCKVT